MRVTCPNCDRRGLLDAESLSDLPSRAVCPRCGAPFRISLSGFEPAPAANAATYAPAAPPAFVTPRATPSHVAAAPRAFIADPLRASTRDKDVDVAAPPRVDTCGEPREDGAGVGLDPGDGLFARELRARPRASADNYRLAVRLMNVSPLWLLAACAGFFALVFAFDLLLTPAPRATGDATALASLNNQATNRDTARRAPAADADQSGEPAADKARRGAGEALTGYDEGSSSGAREQPESSGSKPAPVSDAPRDAIETGPRGAEVSFGNARGELRAGAGGAPQELRITLQLGSFRVASEAGAQADSLRAAGFDARVAEEHNSKRPWYRVQTGLFGARADAEQRLAALRAKGFAADYTVRELQ